MLSEYNKNKQKCNWFSTLSENTTKLLQKISNKDVFIEGIKEKAYNYSFFNLNNRFMDANLNRQYDQYGITQCYSLQASRSAGAALWPLTVSSL